MVLSFICIFFVVTLDAVRRFAAVKPLCFSFYEKKDRGLYKPTVEEVTEENRISACFSYRRVDCIVSWHRFGCLLCFLSGVLFVCF